MKRRRIYLGPGSDIEDQSGDPGIWDSSWCHVLRDEQLWQRFLDAQRALDEVRRAVAAAATEEPLSAEEQALRERAEELHATQGLDSAEWMRRYDEIKDAALKMAESGEGAVP